MTFKRISSKNLFIFLENSNFNLTNVFDFFRKRFKKQKPEIFVHIENSNLKIYLIFINRIDLKKKFSIFENLNPKFSIFDLNQFVSCINKQNLNEENFVSTDFFLTLLGKKNQYYDIQNDIIYDCFECHNKKVKVKNLNVFSYLSSFFIIDEGDELILSVISSLQNRNDFFYDIFSDSSLNLKSKEKKMETFFIASSFTENFPFFLKEKLNFLNQLLQFVISLNKRSYSLSYKSITSNFNKFYLLNSLKSDFFFLKKKKKEKFQIRNKEHLVFLKQFSLLILLLEFFKESFASLLLICLADEINYNFYNFGILPNVNNENEILNQNFLIIQERMILKLLAFLEEKKLKILTLLPSTFEKKTKLVKNFKNKLFKLLNIPMDEDLKLKDLIEKEFKLSYDKFFFTHLIFFILESCQIVSFYTKRIKFASFKSIKYLCINTSLLHLFLSVTRTPSSFPMLAKPLLWDDNLYGGLLNNTSGNLSVGIKTKETIFFKLKKNSTFNALNTQQNSVFIVSPYIQIVEKNFVFLSRCFMKEIEYNTEKINTNFNESIFFLKEEKIYLKSKKFFLESNTSNPILLEKFLNKRKQLIKFLIIFFSAKLLEPFFFRFTFMLDYRLRIYPVANFLSPQGCDFSKALLQQVDPGITSEFLKKKTK